MSLLTTNSQAGFVEGADYVGGLIGFADSKAKVWNAFTTAQIRSLLSPQFSRTVVAQLASPIQLLFKVLCIIWSSTQMSIQVFQRLFQEKVSLQIEQLEPHLTTTSA